MKIKVAEIFYSLQGEGRWAGVPSVFLRTFGCNFTCAGFGMAPGERTTEPDAIASVIEQYKRYEDLPLAATGCDSYASWHPDFTHLSPVMEVKGIVEHMHSLIPHNKWSTDPVSDDIHLVITGGEPLLGWQRSYPDLIDRCRVNGLRNLTFETNGTQFLTEEFREYLFEEFTRHGRDYDRLTFSVSAKLPCSGEKWEDAIKPEVIMQYEYVGYTYLKFVIATEQDFADAECAIAAYRAAGFTGHVYLMPVGGVESVYTLNSRRVADLAMRHGLRYSDRLQVPLFKNEWGT